MNVELLARVGAAILSGATLHVPDGFVVVKEAHEHARRLTGSSVAATYTAERAARATVGHFAVDGLPRGSRFACLDWSQGGTVVEVSERSKRAVNEIWGVDFEEVYEHDWSAYGAALAFVRLVGEGQAEAALDAAEEERGA